MWAATWRSSERTMEICPFHESEPSILRQGRRRHHRAAYLAGLSTLAVMWKEAASFNNDTLLHAIASSSGGRIHILWHLTSLVPTARRTRYIFQLPAAGCCQSFTR